MPDQPTSYHHCHLLSLWAPRDFLLDILIGSLNSSDKGGRSGTATAVKPVGGVRFFIMVTRASNTIYSTSAAISSFSTDHSRCYRDLRYLPSVTYDPESLPRSAQQVETKLPFGMTTKGTKSPYVGG